MFNAPADVAAISAVEQQNAAQLDAGKLAQAYAPSAVVLDYMAPGIYQGRAQLAASFGPQLAAVKSIVPTIREGSIVTDGQFACDATTSDFQFALKSGKTGTMSMRQIDALEKIGGKWQVVQEDISAPMDPKTGMAVLNGLPVRGVMSWSGDMLAGPATSTAQAETEIAQWTNIALRVIGLDAAMKAYGPGADDALLYGEMAPGNVRGVKEITAYYGPVMKSFNKIDIKLLLLKTISDGLLGSQIDVQDITLHLNNGTTRHFSLRQIDCLHRVNGQWHSIEEMVSFPVDLATGKSVALPKY